MCPPPPLALCRGGKPRARTPCAARGAHRRARAPRHGARRATGDARRADGAHAALLRGDGAVLPGDRRRRRLAPLVPHVAAAHVRLEHRELRGDQRRAFGLRRAHVFARAAGRALGARRPDLARADLPHQRDAALLRPRRLSLAREPPAALRRPASRRCRGDRGVRGAARARRRLRLRLLRRGTLLLYATLRRLAPRRAPRRARLWRFQHTLDEGIAFLLQRKDRMLAPAAWITLDWFLTLAILWVAFRAVGQPIGLGLVLVGFGVGLLCSLVSFVPGGLGIMEGSMAAVYVSLGVPLERAVVAVLIFRVAYYVLPLVVSIFLFHGLMRQAIERAEAARV